MATEKLRVGSVGTVSYFNHHFGWAINALPEIEAAASLGRSASYIRHSLGESPDEYAQKHGLALYEDPWEMAEREGLQAVCLATEDHLQPHYAIEAAKRGLHVFMHGPWASNLEDVAAVIAMARENSDELHGWAFDGPFLKDFNGRPVQGTCRDAGAVEYTRERGTQ